MSSPDLPLILAAAIVAQASPGPSNFAIIGTALQSGRRSGLSLASGVTTGSLAWSLAAALGLGAVMAAHVWMVEVLRYAAGAYLLFLAYRSARSVFAPHDTRLSEAAVALSPGRAYLKGLALHLTNPKAIFFFGSLYSLGVSPQASLMDLLTVVGAVGLQSALVFHGYALLFSSPVAARAYVRARRVFEALFALAFAGAGVKILTSRL